MKSLTAHIYGRIKTYALAGTLLLFCYYAFRTFFLFMANYSPIERLFGAIFFLGETYILIHALGFFLNISVKPKIYSSDFEIEKKIEKMPSVAVFVAARHEPKSVLRETFTTLSNIDYEPMNIYLLDDSSDSIYMREADELSEEFGFTIFRRPIRHGAKAGIINDFLSKINEKYIAIFDSDQNPVPSFLKIIIPHLEKDESLAFVQTPQFYTNTEAGIISKAATIQQAIFYELICESKNHVNSMFCCGTNVVFRKAALLDVGGFDEENITEDFSTSLKLHAKGYKSYYLNKVAAFGMAPESLGEYFKQQTRWASGTISVFRKLIISFFKNDFSLTFYQWWEYFLSGTYYFVGWAFFFLMITPIIFLLFNVPSYFIHPAFYILIFFPYFILSIIIFYISMTKKHYPFKLVYLGTIMGMLSFPILMKAAVVGMFNKKMTFNITIKGTTTSIPFWRLWPYHIMIFLNFTAILFGIYKITANIYLFALYINIFWAMYHIFILSHIYYLNYDNFKST